MNVLLVSRPLTGKLTIPTVNAKLSPDGTVTNPDLLQDLRGLMDALTMAVPQNL